MRQQSCSLHLRSSCTNRNTNFRAQSGISTATRNLTDGEVATYIPELGKADPDDFGIGIVTARGPGVRAGDCDRPFTIQSISKPFTFGLALEELGA